MEPQYDEKATVSHIRIKIIKRFGDNWVFLVFFVCTCLILQDPSINIDHSDCTQKLIEFMQLYHYGYMIYLSFLGFTLIGCIYPSLDTLFKRFQIATFVLFFFGIFIYANWIIFKMDFDNNKCNTSNLNLRLFCYFYVIAWYTFLTTRLIMLCMFYVKKHYINKLGIQNNNAIHLFVDIE